MMIVAGLIGPLLTEQMGNNRTHKLEVQRMKKNRNKIELKTMEQKETHGNRVDKVLGCRLPRWCFVLEP
jgi:hypothetical protein